MNVLMQEGFASRNCAMARALPWSQRLQRSSMPQSRTGWAILSLKRESGKQKIARPDYFVSTKCTGSPGDVTP